MKRFSSLTASLRSGFANYRRQSGLTKILILLASVAAAMLAGSVFILTVGANPLQAYYYMLIRPMTSIASLGEVSMYFTPLLLVGIGVSFSFHAKLSNLGGEGQMLLGALGMTLMGVSPAGGILGVWSLPAGILLGIVLGALWAAIAGFFKVRFHASEIIITLMLNYVAEQAISYLVFYPLRSGAEPQSAKIVESLPKLYASSRMNWGVVIALALAVFYGIIVRRTRFGYRLRALGGSEKAAVYSGVRKDLYYFSAMVISGAFCGLAGAIQISGNTMRLMEGVAGDFGFSGIVVAMLGTLHPVGIVIASLFMALLSAGSVTMQVKTGIPTSFTSVLEALIVLFVLLGMAVSGMKFGKKVGKA
jgi:simple sugar transport system permease protein